MSILQSVTKGKRRNPAFVIIYGVDGVGKNTFGAGAPKPIFIPVEETGSDHLDVARTHSPKSVGDLGKILTALATEEHEYETAVIDSLDFVEPLIWAQVCKEGEKLDKSGRCDSIEDYGGGYGKGYVRALELWRRMVDVYIRPLTLKMNVILIAHSHIKAFNDPTQPNPYDRYQIKLHEKSASYLREAVDCVLFATYETTVRTEKNAKKGKAIGDGSRVMYTERRPSFDAKNRFDLPYELPMTGDNEEPVGWLEFAKAVDAFYTPKVEAAK